MRPALLALLAILIFLSLGSSEVFVGCGSGVGGSAGFACVHGKGDDPCDYVVTVEVTVMRDDDGSPIEMAAVTLGSDPPDAVNTRITGEDGIAYWDDTSFLTGFSADCSGRNVGTVEPYESDTTFSHSVLVSASGFAPYSTVLTIDRNSRDIQLTVRMAP